MVPKLTSGVQGRLGRAGGRWLQLAAHWGAYTRYLAGLEADLNTVELPGLGAVRLETTFVAIRLRPWLPEVADSRGGISMTLADVLQADPHVLVVGPAGTGKSALLRWQALSAARTARLAGRRAIVSEAGPPLPIYIPMADVDDTDLLADARRRLTVAGIEPEAADALLGSHLAEGRAQLFFDDLDTRPRAERRRAAARITDLINQYHACVVVVATRDVADAAWLPGFGVFEVAGIDPAQIETLVGRWGLTPLANSSGFLQLVERSTLVRSLVLRPGWLAASLSGVAGATGNVRAFDVVSAFAQHLDGGDAGDWHDIGRAMHEAGTTVGQANQIPPSRRTSGLLQWLTEGEFRFVHLALQAFFAAAAMPDPIALAARAADPWWEPVITLSVGQTDDPRPLIGALIEGGHTALAGLALAEARPMDAVLRQRVVVALLEHMGGGDRDEDRRAAISLAGLLVAESVSHTGVAAPALAALADEDVAIRRAAGAALSRLAEPSAIAPLLTALGDSDAAVRAAAADALATFGARTVQPLVRQLSVPNPLVREAALRALAQQGARAVPALVPLLEGPSTTGRTEAAEALALIGAPAVPALMRLLQSALAEGSRNEAQLAGASEALIRIGPAAAAALVPLFAQAGPAERNQIIEILRAMDADAVAALAEAATTPDDPFSATAATLLGEFADSAADAAEPLIEALADPRFEVRYESRRALRRLGPTAANALVAALDRPDPQVRWEIAQILLELPDPPIEQLTIVLTEALAATDVEDRRRAVKALGSLSGPVIRTTLVQALNDSDSQVRQAAVNQLGRMGDRAAVQPLTARWTDEQDADTGRAILDALVELSPKAAVPILIDALSSEHTELKRPAADLLVEVGEPAVIPLIEALNTQPDQIDLNGALRVLERAGSGARAGGRSPANLARAYSRLVTEPLGLDELVYLAASVEWWPPALELHRTFDAARQFLEYSSLGGIGTAEAALEWVDEIPTWLRPSTAKALRQLRTISQAVQYYNRGATRRSKEKGLLAAADRLNTLRAMVPELGEPHARVFSAVADRWSSLINGAIRELQGQAELDLEVRTEQVRIRDTETAAVLVFEMVNRGEGLASNIQLNLSAEADGLVVESAATHYLPPLGQGDRVPAEFTVRRTGAGVVPLVLEAKYDDPQTEGQLKRFPREVRFVVEDSPYRDIGTSPYIAGPPVKTPEMFYGRRSTFHWIQENLSGTYQENVLVLYGERRTGKTSMLYQLQYNLPDSYAFVLIDMQSIAYSLNSTSDLLYAMARKVVNGLRRDDMDVPRPERQDFAEHPLEQFEELGEVIGTMATTAKRQAVIMLDEFDLLIEAVENGSVNAYVFDCIRGLMQHQDGLNFIFAGAHKLTAMLKNPQSILFNTALRRKVSFLDREDAERLIRQPVADVLWYDDLAVEKILRVTAGQPYFIQYICHEIVNLARRDGKNFVALRDVDRALLTTVQETTGIIRHSYMSLARDEQLALATLSRITDDGRPFVSLEDIIETLKQDHVNVPKRELIETLRQLADRDFITERGGEAAGRQYGFTMDLVRVWLEQNDEYSRLLEETRR